MNKFKSGDLIVDSHNDTREIKSINSSGTIAMFHDSKEPRHLTEIRHATVEEREKFYYDIIDEARAKLVLMYNDQLNSIDRE